MFRQMDLKGQAQVNTKLKSTHQNTVNAVRVFQESNGEVSSFSSKYFCRTLEREDYINQDLSEWRRWTCRHLVHLTRTPVWLNRLLEYKLLHEIQIYLFSEPSFPPISCP